MATHETPKKRSTIIKLKNSSEEEDSSESESDDDFFDREKIKKKFLSAWNNVKYGINVQYKPSFENKTPIWFLGRMYCKDEKGKNSCFVDEQFKLLPLDSFFEDFSSLIWLTYRKHFSELANSDITSDGGWGCMLRSGQMMLANALLIHMLKEKWRTSQRRSDERNFTYRMILRFFNDESSDHSPFSLHELVRIGRAYTGKLPGEWYGPTSVAHVLSAAVNTTSHPALETLRVYVAQDCTVYIEDVVQLSLKCKNCTEQKCRDKGWRSMLILVPIRLGSDGLNPIYIPCLQTLLAMDHCIGIIGGRPKHSLYFVGFQDQMLIHLDPHYLQDTVDMSAKNFPVDSFKCQYPKKMGFHKMDPSCAVGFYCRTREDFDDLCVKASKVSLPPLQRTEYPMFVFDKGSSPNHDSDELDGVITELASQTIVQVSYTRTKKHKKKKTKKKEIIEEYVVYE